MSYRKIIFWRSQEFKFVTISATQRVIGKLRIQYMYQPFLAPGPYLAIALSNNPRNCLREVWYIQFTMLISTIKKYRMLPRVATKRQNKQIVYIL